MEENQDTGLETEPETEPTRRGKSSLKRLKDRLKLLDKLASDPKVKAAKQADVAIEAAGIEKLLFQTERDDKADKNLALNEQLTAQHEQDTAEIARLTQVNVELTALRASQAGQPQIPDDRIPALQQEVQTFESLLQDVSALARSVDIEERTRHAVSLVIKHGKRKELMSVVEGLGVDYASVVTSLNRSETELLTLLKSAGREGTATPIWRAVLAVKYEIQVDGHGKRRYRDEFSDDSSLYADTL
jgi:hypothetical protein